MNKQIKLNIIATAVLAAFLTGCGGDAETVINELEPIVTPPADSDHDHDHDHGDGNIIIESMGRLAILSEQSLSLSILDIDDGNVLDSFSVTHSGSRLYSSPGYRYAALSARSEDSVTFVDGGLWREDHVDHLHDYEQSPQMSDFMLTGSRPTHIGSFDGQMTVFYDGDSEAGIPAAVQVLTDTDILQQNSELPTLNYTVNMHGVAKASGDMLITTFRRDDADSASTNFILPDQVAIYHLHDGEYELEQTLEHTCPDLHGAAQNEQYLAFGCGDGVLLTHAHDEEFESSKVANIAALDGIRVGTIYGHKESPLFFGIASSRATGQRVFVSINPESESMEVVDWESEAAPVAYSFNAHGDAFVILDNQGMLTKYELHTHEGEMEFELATSLDISEADLSQMPENHNFTMTFSQSDEHLYVADPIAQHVLRIDVEEMSVEGDMEVDVVPSSLVWLGIAEEEHDHDH